MNTLPVTPPPPINPDTIADQSPGWKLEAPPTYFDLQAQTVRLEKQLAAMTARRDFWRWAAKALWTRKVLEFGELAALARKHLPPK